MSTAHLPHVVWIRYLGSRHFIAHFRGTMEKATEEILKVRKDDTVRDAYVLPEGVDVELWHKQRQEEDRKNGFA